MKRILTLTVAIVGLFLATNSHAAIWGPLSVCVGGTSTLTPDSLSTSGTWSSSNLAVGTVGVTTGAVTGMSAGTTVITWHGSSSTSTVVFTVNPAPSAIGGGTSAFCPGSTTTLTNSLSGGSWYTYAPSIATVGVTSGIVTGVAAGTANIMYSMTGGGAGCNVTKTVTVSPTGLSDVLSGPTTVCVGSTITVGSTAGGGAWTSTNPAIATVSSTGVVTGVAAGMDTIRHTITGTCGSLVTSRVITVTSTPAPGAITGTATVSVGSSSLLSCSPSGGTWSSGSTSIATITSGGTVTGVALGTAVITYTTSGCTGPMYATTIVTVAPLNCISGDVQFTSGSYVGMVKVWLIKYNPTTLMLTACDSTYAYSSGTSASYSFCGMGTDSFRVKAACDSFSSSVGYVPTYHTSSAFWHSAGVIAHVAGTHDINKHITMIAGTPTSGPGFIAGDVTTGANKGTTDFVPAPGMLIYCVNNTTGAILQQTITDASGHYSFSNLPVGEPYKIYPEMINYATTPYSAITLTTASPSKSAADFQQHTVSMTITPKPTAIELPLNTVAGISVFPNPASGKLNVQWNVANAGTGTIVVADVTGRVVLSATADMSQVTGNVSLNLNGISKGIYIVSLRANGVNYNNKIEIQ